MSHSVRHSLYGMVENLVARVARPHTRGNFGQAATRGRTLGALRLQEPYLNFWMGGRPLERRRWRIAVHLGSALSGCTQSVPTLRVEGFYRWVCWRNTLE
jgi:hypothetical protein